MFSHNRPTLEKILSQGKEIKVDPATPQNTMNISEYGLRVRMHNICQSRVRVRSMYSNSENSVYLKSDFPFHSSLCFHICDF